MSVILNGSVLHLTGSVGHDWIEDSFSHAEVLMALAEVGAGTDISIHLNSPGGYTDQAEGIANSIKLRAGKTSVVVTGVAMSAATIIACAGDEVAMCDGAMWMIHEPHVSILFADIAGVAAAAQYQHLVAEAYVETYVARTGKDADEIRALMKATTYLDAGEAVAAGFADRKTSQTVDYVEVAPAFPYADEKLFAHAPHRLVARAEEKNWTLSEGRRHSASVSAIKDGNQPMSKTEREELEALRAEKKARENADAIMALDEAHGREDQATELAKAGVSVEAAKAVLSAGSSIPSARSERRLNGEGLRGPALSSMRPAAQSSLAATMRARHGVKEA